MLMKKKFQLSKKIMNKKWLRFRKNWKKKINKFHSRLSKSRNLMKKFMKNFKPFKALKKKKSSTKNKLVK
jgi:hypothetical protein